MICIVVSMTRFVNAGEIDCGYIKCNSSSHWCDTVTKDCVPCSPGCQTILDRDFCEKHCLEFWKKNFETTTLPPTTKLPPTISTQDSSRGWIVAAVVGSLAFLIIAAVLLVICHKRCRQRTGEDPPTARVSR